MTVPFGGPVRDPQEWMREQERRSAVLLAKAEQAKADLENNVVTLSSPDRLVTVTVNPGGGLTSLALSPQAQDRPPAQLASLIMSTYRKATTRAADRTLEIMAGLTGEDSEAVDFLKSTLPPREEPQATPEPDDSARFGVPAEPPPTPPAKPRPPRPISDEDDGEDFQHVDWTGRS
ncbi:YbaB/EbfC family nucleoid-associated protein [Amycolatopsis sp. QT-25]|uniref:YbaB/EbfC family nucleoid-associated protein n=1 Tax=Amycolatopsis sp. QT-25 TaxID=3034022 RepID=UPI0023EBF17F|nr:YbaB/EbfC family nucleoid-associated protein [Amycolatopsis sp. QT-25]WET81788.1 YbaB/EbfC family nucleoid-associated protein [Amycolatopsis sp. QT-25]